jgi:hypothetical protein
MENKDEITAISWERLTCDLLHHGLLDEMTGLSSLLSRHFQEDIHVALRVSVSIGQRAWHIPQPKLVATGMQPLKAWHMLS